MGNPEQYVLDFEEGDVKESDQADHLDNQGGELSLKSDDSTDEGDSKIIWDKNPPSQKGKDASGWY